MDVACGHQDEATAPVELRGEAVASPLSSFSVWQRRAIEAPRRLAVAAAAGYIAVFLILACFRVPYPFELEWLEGGMAQQAQRVLAEQPLYCPPSIEYVPFIYPPLYALLSAGLCHFMGVGFTPLRLLSLIATLGCFLVIYRHVRRETGSGPAAFTAMGIYAATYRLGGAWFDVARVDALFLFFLLLALYWARFAKSRWGYAAAGLALAAAYMTKQAAIATAIPLILACLAGDWRRAWPVALLPCLIAGSATVALDYLSGGWYSFYLFGSAWGHGVEPVMKLGFWTKDLGGHFAIGCALALMGLCLQLSRPGWRVFGYYALVTLGVVAMCYASRLHRGGYDNVLMPVYAWFAVLVGLAIGGAARLGKQGYQPWTLGFESGLFLAVLLQFTLLLYNPLAQIPRDRAAGTRLLDLLRGTEGEVFIPYHNFYGAMAGKKTYAHRMGLNDFLGGNSAKEWKDMLNAELTKAFREGRFALLVLDSLAYDALLSARYERGVIPYKGNAVFRPVTGYPARPVYYYYRRD